MLTTDTKRHIDSARQVLVGKVPNPLAQVQEITKALIYKFMDDMDEQAATLGGKRRYFVGDYEKYSWRTIMSPQVGAQDRIDLYQEALKKMSINPGIPPLFQQIFRNAHLPYNDGRTLTLFLTEINYFDYKHSEELGNAYEYLLSIMGSQGDAGQFRTPRHIIDFIVGAVDPSKNDKVLDPACGTAGFLISAYKHVVAKHDGKDDLTGEITTTETPLTADEKRKLHTNYTGFDIDDEMVRLSQVNMFLHGFTSPNIIVHDSLSSEDYWNDRYDVILANPPFMTPKGGIVPHKKFGVQSNRAEVLFVDYIVSHLKPSGRAGVIVPEGIIFQSGTAYKQLRKNLVENGLYAVVSLPSGVFNPYSGVKTSILLFNNERAKQKKEIVFIKIESDGYDLGAQRRIGTKDDLPVALNVLNKWNDGEKIDNKQTLYVEKSKIAESSDYNLSGDRYRVTTDYSNAKWPMVELGEVCEITAGQSPEGKYYNEKAEGLPFYQGKTEFTDKYIGPPKHWTTKTTKVAEKNDILMSVRAPVGPVNIATQRICIGRGLASIRPTKAMITYIYFLLASMQSTITGKGGATFDSINKADIAKIKIPLPPLEVQEQIVAELDGYANIIAGAKQITQNWKPQIPIDPDWQKVPIGQICELYNGKAFKPSDWEKKESGGLPIIRIQNLNNDKLDFNYFTGKVSNQVIINNGDLLFSWSGSRGSSFGPHIWKGQKAILNQHIFKVIHKNNVLRDFLYLMLKDSVKEVEDNLHGGVGLVHITKGNFERIEIPVPSLDIQEQIVNKIEAERALVESAEKLIEIYEQKTKAVISKLWEK